MTQDPHDSVDHSGSDSDAVFAELNELVLARQNESITAAQMARLEELVVSNQQARRMYVRYMVESTVLHQLLSPNAGTQKETRDLEALQESLLAQRFGVEGDEQKAVIATVGPVNPTTSVVQAGFGDGEASVETSQHRKRWGRKIAAAALIGLSLMGALIYMMMPGDPPPPPQPVATLTESHHATWEDKDGRLIFIRDGKALPPQTLFLADGLAKLTFKDGAVVLLDARQYLARFELKSPSAGFLHVGKLAARAESESSKGFTVGVPGNMRVVDLSTEFGVIVDEDGGSQVHVIDGSVEAVRVDQEGRITERVVVNQAEALAIQPPVTQEQSYVINTDIESDESAFQRVMPTKTIAQSVEINQSKFDRRWTDYVTTLKSDQSLVFYLDGHDQQIPSDRKAVGRFGKQSAVRFAVPGDELTLAGQARWRVQKDLTVAAWIKPNADHTTFALIVGKGEEPERNYSLWLNSSAGADRSFHFSANDERQINYFMSSETTKSTGWSFVVGVIQSGRLKLFVDGHLSGAPVSINTKFQKQVGDDPPAAADTIQSLAMTDAPLSIGRSPEANHLNNFQGLIGMVAIFDRALSEDEIGQMYEAGRPY